MAFSKYKLKTSDEKRGVWIDEEKLVAIIRILERRNSTLFKEMVENYEYLENKKFDNKKGVQKILD
jgi:hypothetical protein